eukprot:CAMPEP_0168398636 /NCGR_PEP_ID=MMETSP0228-20121227/21683_1 /TAXON_ID=133427 /ORGANISM="Protoceratium reticulatum, Strain CCCM 535 (=CCMP 1889)" /LENGTH=543 /DNA_ID=CAMNT_0008412149 /DNA_START=68 /DNA_END=1699 /DNA_ORIENTATION=-
MADEGEQSGESSVGVLGWLGFIIINSAAFGIIAVGSVIAWPLGFGISLVYTAITIALAVFLGRRYGDKYRQFVNLLWVLGCSFVFILGLYISINVIGPTEDTSSPSTPGFPGNPDSLTALLPNASSAGLVAWAQDSLWAKHRSPTFASFGGSLFFGGVGNASVTSRDQLWRSPSGAAPALVSPPLTDPYSFAEYQSRLYFSAEPPLPSGSTSRRSRELWSLPSAAGQAEFVASVADGQNGGQVRHLFADADSSLLYFKATYQCPVSGYFTQVESVFSHNGATNSTTNLRSPACPLSNGTGGGSFAASGEPSKAQLWSVLFLACVPMVALAAFVLAFLKMPGMFLNIFAGIWCAVVVVYILAMDRDTSNLTRFLKYFVTIYSAFFTVGIVVVQQLVPDTPNWLDELKTWAVAISSTTFFVIIHINLEIPFTSTAWHWIVYAILCLAHMVYSILVARTIPMVLGAIGAFVVAWKISDAIVDALSFNWSGEVKTLTMLGILAAQGVAIILGAIVYASRREQVDGWARDLLGRCSRGQSKVETVADP